MKVWHRAKPGPPPHRIHNMSMSGRGGGRASLGLGAIAGLLAAGAALGVGQFVAGLTGASGSPVVAVGELQIDFTPPWLKNFAITEFGSDDKLVLVSGIVVVLAIFAAVIGAAATRRMAYGLAGLTVFAAGRADRRRDQAHRHLHQPAADPRRGGGRGGRAACPDSAGQSPGRQVCPGGR